MADLAILFSKIDKTATPAFNKDVPHCLHTTLKEKGQ
jgi:hypothetical protein